MQTDTMLQITPSIYTLNKKDIGELLRRLQLSVIPGSPLQTVAEATEAITLTETTEALLKDTPFTAALQVMAAPQKLIRVYAGGGMQPRGDLFVCIHTGINAAPLVAITPSFENSWVILAFPETVQGIAWLLDTVAGTIEEAPIAPFPETFTPEFLIYTLGAIDQYRRCSYENMLNHVQDESYSFTLETFAGNIEKELKSGDLRWLLPSFVALTPGFHELNLTEDKMVYEQLIDADMMLPVSTAEAGLRFGFGEVGKDLGTEFLRTWVKSAGIAVSNITSGGVMVEHQAFLANTFLANHFFEILPATDTRNRIRYAPLTRNALGEILETWATPTPEILVPAVIIQQVEQAPAVVVEIKTVEPEVVTTTAAETIVAAETTQQEKQVPAVEAAVKTVEPVAATTAATATINCINCGKPVLPNAHFCPKCGTILTPKKKEVPVQKFCSQCGQPVNEKNRFCSKCGKPVH